MSTQNSKKIIYGGFIAALLISVSSSSLKSIIPPNLVNIATSFHVGIEQVTIGPTIFMVTYACTSPLIGKIVDIISAKIVILLGLGLAGISLILANYLPNISGFIVLYGICGGFAYNCISYVPIGVFVEENIHSKNKGLAFGLLANGNSIGFIVLAPLWIYLSSQTSWNKVFICVGIIFIALLVFSTLAIPCRHRSTVKATKQGDTELVLTETITILSQDQHKTLWKSKSLWLLALTFSTCGLSMGLIDVHIVGSLHQTGIDKSSIGIIVSIFGIFELVFGILAGFSVDKGLHRQVIVGSYWLRSLALFLLAFSHNFIPSLLFGVIFGVSYMGTVIVTTQYVMQNFHSKNKGLALGIIWFIHNLGAALSSQLGAWSIERFHSYQPVILGIATVCGISGIICVTLFPRNST